MVEEFASLDHINVLPLIWTTIEPGRFIIVSPWAEKGTLTSYMDDMHGRLTDVQILTLVCVFTLTSFTRGLNTLRCRFMMLLLAYIIVRDTPLLFYAIWLNFRHYQCIQWTSYTVAYLAYVVLCIQISSHAHTYKSYSQAL
jgi:hypothetical protein